MHPWCCTSTAWCLFCSGRAPVGIWHQSGPTPAPGKHKKSPAHPPCCLNTSAVTAADAGVSVASGPRGLHKSGSVHQWYEWSFLATSACLLWSSRSARGSLQVGCGGQARSWTPPGLCLANSSGCCHAGRGRAVEACAVSRSEWRWWNCYAGRGWPSWGVCETCYLEEPKGHCWTGPKLSAGSSFLSADCSGHHLLRNNYEKIYWGLEAAVSYYKEKLLHWKSGFYCCSSPAAQGLASYQIHLNPLILSHYQWGRDPLTVPAGWGMTPR